MSQITGTGRYDTLNSDLNLTINSFGSGNIADANFTGIETIKLGNKDSNVSVTQYASGTLDGGGGTDTINSRNLNVTL